MIKRWKRFVSNFSSFKNLALFREYGCLEKSCELFPKTCQNKVKYKPKAFQRQWWPHAHSYFCMIAVIANKIWYLITYDCFLNC